jgi:hypothetical protein
MRLLLMKTYSAPGYRRLPATAQHAMLGLLALATLACRAELSTVTNCPGYTLELVTLPAMTNSDSTTLDIGGKIRIDTTHLLQVTTDQKQKMADTVGVPQAVINKLWDRFTNQPQPGPQQLARQLQLSGAGYKTVLKKWDAYNPLDASAQDKSNALKALEAGDVDTAWALYSRRQQTLRPPALGVRAGE